MYRRGTLSILFSFCRSDDGSDDAGARLAVPLLRRAPVCLSVPLCFHRFSDIFAPSTGDGVRPAGYRNGLSVFSRTVTQGNAQAGGFLLNAAGIRYHNFRMAHQAKKIKIPKRFQNMNPVGRSGPFRAVHCGLAVLEVKEGFESEFADAFCRSWMRRKENWA